ncbi:hypothetical protein K438DRAFT_1765478 [Mycena galopus ATCC 62051]|nr:hypothetical protein K438DRAFT_1765478 [Mycena galopus ATCC 62051]
MQSAALLVGSVVESICTKGLPLVGPPVPKSKAEAVAELRRGVRIDADGEVVGPVRGGGPACWSRQGVGLRSSEVGKAASGRERKAKVGKVGNAEDKGGTQTNAATTFTCATRDALATWGRGREKGREGNARRRTEGREGGERRGGNGKAGTGREGEERTRRMLVEFWGRTAPGMEEQRAVT